MFHEKVHYGRGKFTVTVIRTNVEALGHDGLTITLLVDHNPLGLTTIVVRLP